MAPVKRIDATPLYLRNRLELDAHEWARILGVSDRTVERWEDGTPPSGLASEVLRGIARALEVGVDPRDIRNRINLGLGAFIALSLSPRPTGKRP